MIHQQRLLLQILATANAGAVASTPKDGSVNGGSLILLMKTATEDT
jgi:hypothetical protein